MIGIDRHPWAVGEAAHTYRQFALPATTRQGDAATSSLPKGALLAAFTLNELPDEAREALLETLLARAAGGDCILIVEPIAGSAARWWNGWSGRFESVGGRADEWRVRASLPAIVAKLDRAAGLKHHEITGKSIWSCRARTGRRTHG